MGNDPQYFSEAEQQASEPTDRELGLLSRITQLEAQLQAAGEAHAEKVCEVGRLEGERDTWRRSATEAEGEVEAYQAAERDLLDRLADIEAQLHSKSPRWRLVSEGWPKVEGEYFVQIGDWEKGGVEYSVEDWDSKFHDDYVAVWQGEEITRFISVDDLKKLPGGPGESTAAPSDPTPEPDEQKRCTIGTGCVFIAGHDGHCCPF